MELDDKVAVVTGGGNGIGRAMCERFATSGARAVVVADIDAAGATRTADTVAAQGVQTLATALDVGDEVAVADLVRQVETSIGPIDLFCSNAGVGLGTGLDTPAGLWIDEFRVNVLAHVFAARAVLPSMLRRGRGYLLHTASAAGLLTNLGNLPYSVTKHAAVALAEWLSIVYHDAGIRVSCLCPQAVRTNMMAAALEEGRSGAAVLAAGEMLEPEAVAEAVVEGLREERFLILPHPEVATYFARRGADHERWLAGMRRVQAQLTRSGA